MLCSHLIDVETVQRAEWAAATNLFNWGALLVPASAASSSSFYEVCAFLPPSGRATQRQATLDAFLSFLPNALPLRRPPMHVIVVTDGDGRRHYGFLAKTGTEEGSSVLLLESSFPAFAPATTVLSYLIKYPSAVAVETLLVQGLPAPLPGLALEVPLPRPPPTGPSGRRDSAALCTEAAQPPCPLLLRYSWRLGSPLPEDGVVDGLLVLGLGPLTLTRLWLALLFERKVILTTRGHPQLLPLLCEVGATADGDEPPGHVAFPVPAPHRSLPSFPPSLLPSHPSSSSPGSCLYPGPTPAFPPSPPAWISAAAWSMSPSPSWQAWRAGGRTWGRRGPRRAGCTWTWTRGS